MDDIEEMPQSLPCSAPEAKTGLPPIVQLYLVDEALERNPEPREDFYRQDSITPDTETPPPEIILQESKDFAAMVAKSLKQFHAGRVMLRKEEAEQHGDLEQDPEYWVSKAYRWRKLGTVCSAEWRKRKKKEREMEAEKGYADALLLSPAQSLSPAPSGRVPSESLQHSKPIAATSSGSPDNNMYSSQPLARTSQEPSELKSGYNCDDPPTLPKDRKRKISEVEDQEPKSLERTCRTKRQRRGIAATQQKQEPVPNTKSTEGIERTMPQLRSTQKRKHSEVEDQEHKTLEHTGRLKRQKRGITTTQQKQEPVPNTKSTEGMSRSMPQLRSTKALGRTRRKVPSPPPPQSNPSGTNAQNHTSIKTSKQPTEKVSSRSSRKNTLSHQPKPGYSSDSISNVTRRGKLSHTSLCKDERRSLNEAISSKRQRKGTLNPLPQKKPHTIPTSGEGPGEKSWKVATVHTDGASRLKELQASRVLPWVLRPRDPISYCEVGTRGTREREKNRTQTNL